MTEAVNVKNNSFYSLLSISSRLISNVIIFWFLARYFGANIFGKFTYAHTLSTTFILIADFGFDLLLITEIAHDRINAQKTFLKYFWIKLTLALFALIAMWLFVILMGKDSSFIILGLLFGLYMIFNTMANFFVALFKGFERLDYETKVSIVMNFTLLFIAVILALFKQSIYAIAGAFVLSRIAGLLYSLNLSKKVIPGLTYYLVFENLSDTLKKTFVFGLLIVSSSLLYQLDTIILGILKNDTEVGIYQAVLKLILLPLVIPGVINNALLPTLARLNYENYEKWVSLSRLLFKILMWISLPISIIIFVYPAQIIELVYPAKDYAASIPILRIFSLILFIRFFADYFGVILATSKRQKIQMYITVSGIVLNVVLNIFVIPVYGAYGAAVVSLVTSIFVVASFFIVNFRLFISWLMDVKYLFLAVIFVFAFLIAWYFKSGNIFIAIPAIVIIYITISFLILFSHNEKQSLLSWNLSSNIFKKK